MVTMEEHRGADAEPGGIWGTDVEEVLTGI
jgi:hypothetical protein